MDKVSNLDNAELHSISDHVHAVFDELAGVLDNEPAVAQSLKVLIESDTATEDFVVLLTAQPNVGQRILMAGISALVNVHSLVTARNELARRAEGN